MRTDLSLIQHPDGTWAADGPTISVRHDHTLREEDVEALRELGRAAIAAITTKPRPDVEEFDIHVPINRNREKRVDPSPRPTYEDYTSAKETIRAVMAAYKSIPEGTAAEDAIDAEFEAAQRTVDEYERGMRDSGKPQ